jgi:4'-phosphopantetheinyl transferase
MLALGYRYILPMHETELDVSRSPRDPQRGRRRRLQSHVAHSLLAAMLNTNLDGQHWELLHAVDGKPEVRLYEGAAPISVALSHSHDVAACAISDRGTIGVDVEYRTRRRPIAAIAAYAFGDAERQAVEAGGSDVFYRIWTLREAYAKASGAGFPLVLDRRDYFPTAPKDGVWQSKIDGRGWIFSAGTLGDDYAIAVALSAEAAQVTETVAQALRARAC